MQSLITFSTNKIYSKAQKQEVNVITCNDDVAVICMYERLRLVQGSPGLHVYTIVVRTSK